MDGFDRSAYQVTRDAALVAIAKAPAERIQAWAKTRGWSRIALVSGSDASFHADYKCQGDADAKPSGDGSPSADEMQWAGMLVFRRRGGKIFLFWSSEAAGVDTVWPYWNLMDLTPAGRPDRLTPLQDFRSEFFEKNDLEKQ